MAHKNSTIVSHAFYLMSEGGDFNNCHISGIGKEKSKAILYLTLSTYLPKFADFKDFYSAVKSACLDLYPNENDQTCLNVDNALKSTEIDQQDSFLQLSPVCFGKKPTPAKCN